MTTEECVLEPVTTEIAEVSSVEEAPAFSVEQLKRIIEAALMAAGEPLSIDRLSALFVEPACPSASEIREAIASLCVDYADRSVELKELASGFVFQVKADFSTYVARLWEERPQRYSRALLETLALIAYRQPITRAEIEEVRGVAVSSHIMKTLQEREWIRIVGHRDVPGKPGLYATTRHFLDHFKLKNLAELPSLTELVDLDKIEVSANLPLEDESSDAEVSLEIAS
jgi:segregation and condensation protein B